MQLCRFPWSALVLAQFAQVALQKEPEPEFFCLSKNCFSISWISKRFDKSRGICKEKKGDLMTVKSSLQAEAIAKFMGKVQKDDARVWIGLELTSGCTDLQQPLRGFTWVTGDSDTDYTNWKGDGQEKCGALCATVSKDGTWEETPCNHKADGFLCEITYSSTCTPLNLTSSYSASYYHLALGFGHLGGTVFPPGTIAEVATSSDITKLSCEGKSDGNGVWTKETPGAWSCLIDDGGCEHECLEGSDIAKCKCPPGSELKTDLRGCTKPCDPNPCSQHCDPVSDPSGFLCMCSEGFILGADGRTCEDIDDCAANPNICEHHCTNTIGGFVCGCKPGFEMVNATCDPEGGCVPHCEDIDECDEGMCEHDCENYPGGHRCVCHEGFVINENNWKKCKQVCNTSTCQPECHSSGKCTCPDGYILETEDGANVCTDVDECVQSPCDQTWSCINTFGSFQCTCPEGYIIHNVGCVPTTGAPSDTPLVVPPSTSRPADIYSLQPTIMWGIFSGILSMVLVLLAMMCHRMRRHYIYQHDLDYNYMDTDKDVVLKKIMMEPQWQI